MRKIFLITISSENSDFLPLGAANIISHCNKNSNIRDNYTFLDPEFRYNWDTPDFHEKLKQSDIIGLSCFVWNMSSVDTISKLYKTYKPNGIIVYGGPQVPKNEQQRAFFASERPYVDYFIDGIGELKFEKFLDNTADDTRKLEIPTPYLDGTLDNIIHNWHNLTHSPLVMITETNRGCPYHCSFCDWGGLTRSKITMMPEEDVFKTLKVFVSNKNTKRIDFLDANFGMFERDQRFVEYVLENKPHEGVEMGISGFAKNGSKWVVEIMKLITRNTIDRRRNIRLGIQTLGKETLETIKRKNIRTDTMIRVINEVQEDGSDVTGEMIIGLPGETADSWAHSLFTLHQTNVSILAYPLFVLPNTDIDDPVYQKEHGIKTKNLIKPNGEKFTVVYQCNSFDLDELVKMYLYYWYYYMFIDYGMNRNVNIGDMYEFFNTLNEKPYIKSHIDKISNALRNIFNPHESNTVLNEYEFFFIARNYGKGDELYHFKHNIETVRKELNLPFLEILEDDEMLKRPGFFVGRTKVDVKEIKNKDRNK